jgi:NAD(P)-dependent dehydrogenase (short-subunit alcohol dehydrogenase family)
MRGRLEHKGVVVTGAAGGIGREIARAAADAGACVCLVDLHRNALAEVVDGLAQRERHFVREADLADLSTHDRILTDARATFGHVDVLIHAAAVLRRAASIDAITEDDWDAQIDVNLKATFFLNRAAARVFREQGRGGRIINFASQGWWTGGFAGSIVYAASKGGVVSLSRGLARTLASDGITVNTIAPGAVDTPMLHEGLSKQALNDFIDTIPVGRPASPSEIAAVAVFLAADEASYLTGATINVSGGQLMY